MGTALVIAALLILFAGRHTAPGLVVGGLLCILVLPILDWLKDYYASKARAQGGTLSTYEEWAFAVAATFAFLLRGVMWIVLPWLLFSSWLSHLPD